LFLWCFDALFLLLPKKPEFGANFIGICLDAVISYLYFGGALAMTLTPIAAGKSIRCPN
jgi:hypothetical protein